MDERDAGVVVESFSESHQTQNYHQKPLRREKLSQSSIASSEEARLQNRRRRSVIESSRGFEVLSRLPRNGRYLTGRSFA